jgi:hypothetical protein
LHGIDCAVSVVWETRQGPSREIPHVRVKRAVTKPTHVLPFPGSGRNQMKNGSISLAFPYLPVRDDSRVMSPSLIRSHSKWHKKAPTSQPAQANCSP